MKLARAICLGAVSYIALNIGTTAVAQTASPGSTQLGPVVVESNLARRAAKPASNTRRANRRTTAASGRSASRQPAVASERSTASTTPNTGSPLHGYVATNGTAGTKTNTPLNQTPGSISVITHDQIVDQDVQSVAQALRYTPGVAPEQRGINTDTLEYLYSRGFLADTYLDGLRLPSPGQAGFNITSRDIYLIDHIESVRGPASILYGQTPPGGIVDIVSKLPQETPFNEIFFQTGSYGRAQGGFDSTGPLNDDKTLLYRVTGVGLNTGTQTDFVNEQRIAIAPSFTWKIDPDTKLTAYLSYQKDPQAGNYNFVPAAGTVLPGAVTIPRSMDLGDPGFDRFTKEELSAGYAFEHQLTDVWDLKQNFRYLHNDQTVQQINTNGAPSSTGILPRYAYINTGALDSLTVDNEAIATFNTGELKHKALFGVDYQFSEYDHYFYYGYKTAGTVAPSLNLLSPAYNLPIATPNFSLGTSTAQGLSQTGIYAQDQISLGKWTVVGGLRQDWANINSYAYNSGTTTTQNWNALTGHFGLLYNFDSGVTPYFSYATSFQPLTGTTGTGGTPLQPTEGEQYEVGVKYQPVGTKSFITLAAFDLRQTNVVVASSVSTGLSTQTGEVRSQGIEVEAHAYLTDRLQAIGAYTYDSVVNTVATAAMIGKAPTGIPLNMASGFLSYEMPENMAPGLKLSGGVRYLDSTFGDTANTFKVPSVTLVDLGVQYDFSRALPQAKGWSGNVNVTNLFDKSYIASCFDASDCVFGPGRLVLAGVKYRW